MTEIDQFWIYNGSREWSLRQGGEEQKSVPDLSGLTVDDAKEALSLAGLSLGDIYYETSDENGKVISQEPAAGSNLGAGASVKIVIGN